MYSEFHSLLLDTLYLCEKKIPTIYQNALKKRKSGKKEEQKEIAISEEKPLLLDPTKSSPPFFEKINSSLMPKLIPASSAEEIQPFFPSNQEKDPLPQPLFSSQEKKMPLPPSFSSLIKDPSMRHLIGQYLPELSLYLFVFGIAKDKEEELFYVPLKEALKVHLGVLLLITSIPSSLEEKGYYPSLILSFSPLPTPSSTPHFLLDPIDNYRKEKQAKKALWNALCHMFSRQLPKSS